MDIDYIKYINKTHFKDKERNKKIKCPHCDIELLSNNLKRHINNFCKTPLFVNNIK